MCMALSSEYAKITDSDNAENRAKAAAIIDDWRLATGETFGEHRKYCDGCPDCIALFTKRNKLLEETKETAIAGIPMWKILNLRAQHDFGINFYFPENYQIYDEHGEIDRDYYIFCQVKGFTDDQIRKYFGIKSDDWNDFKTKYFPQWRQKSQDYLNTFTKQAIAKWTENHPKQVRIIQETKKERHKINASRL